MEVNQFGGVVGGPVRKDKDFMLLELSKAGRKRFRSPAPGHHRFPSICATGSNFGNYGITVYRSADDALLAAERRRNLQRIAGLHILAQSFPG